MPPAKKIKVQTSMAAIQQKDSRVSMKEATIAIRFNDGGLVEHKKVVMVKVIGHKQDLVVVFSDGKKAVYRGHYWLSMVPVNP